MPRSCLLSLACLALGTALAPAPARSQSAVAVNGLLDIGVFKGFDGVRQVGTIQRSNVAVSGTEDLGDGLKATFRLSASSWTRAATRARAPSRSGTTRRRWACAAAWAPSAWDGR